MEYPKFKVAVCCMTYNQSKYITDAMNGFTMQQTDFPFVCTIVDDASTDGEQEVIRKYVEDNFDFSEGSVAYHKETDYAFITYAQHKSNKNCYFAVLYLKENHYSQRKPKMGYLSEWRDMYVYEALCEGDDYWIDENKLQKQVTFLDNNRNYALCFSNAQLIVENNIKSDIRTDLIESRDYSPSELFEQWIVPTASILVRKEIYSLDLKGRQHFVNGDIVIILSAAKLGKIKCMNEKMVVYRIQPGGVTYSDETKISRYISMNAHFEAIRDNFYDVINTSFIDRKIAHCYLRRLKYETDHPSKQKCIKAIWNNSKLVFLRHCFSIIKLYI